MGQSHVDNIDLCTTILVDDFLQKEKYPCLRAKGCSGRPQAGNVIYSDLLVLVMTSDHERQPHVQSHHIHERVHKAMCNVGL